MGVNPKSKRRRRGRHPDFSSKGKKKNRRKMHRLARPTGLHVKRRSPVKAPALGWKSILTTLGILYLLGAGPLNRSDELIWPTAGVQPPSDREAKTHVEEISPSPHLGLPWRADGLTHNFLANSTPLSNQELTPWSPASDLAPAKKGFHSETFSRSAGESIAARATAGAPDAEPLRSSDASRLPRKFSAPALITRDPSSTKMSLVMTPVFSSPLRRSGLRWERLALIETGSIGLTIFGFRKFDEFFGGAQKSFRAGNDWTKDRTLHFDELIHFQGGYRIAQGMIGMYRWAGLNAAWSEGLGAGTAASMMTALEYIDGRRPGKRGASYSDFTANLLGVGFALAKLHIEALQDVDLRLNYTSFGDVLQKKTLLKYDRMTHWLTYDMKRQWRVPLHVGVGYGVQNAFKSNVRSEIYLGVGLTPLDILERYYPAAAKPLAWLNMYHIGWQVQIK